MAKPSRYDVFRQNCGFPTEEEEAFWEERCRSVYTSLLFLLPLLRSFYLYFRLCTAICKKLGLYEEKNSTSITVTVM